MLDSWQVIVCRPIDKATELLELLQFNSVQGIAAPLISIEPGRDLNVMPSMLASLSRGSLVFLLSPNVFLFERHLSDAQIAKIKSSFSPNLQYYAIGQSTAAKFFDCIGLEAEYPEGKEISEELIKLPSLIEYIQNKHDNHTTREALIIRGNGGRDIVANVLKENHFYTREIEAYHRIENPSSLLQFKKSITQSIKNIIVITSGEMLENLIRYLKNEDVMIRQKTLSSYLIVVSERIAKIANTQGFSNIVIAKKANNQALMKSILETIQHAKNI
ncbi:uroporphyrinogen-III synthase [Thorsellia kenyensis]|uniref:Uroporphyrinogen-III synthase n=1 Tax=Thorsellia kenyensis TaxID=1549888 RepID=A0ABV6C816_9GAMM